jgi:hypothetical protein
LRTIGTPAYAYAYAPECDDDDDDDDDDVYFKRLQQGYHQI